MPHGASCSRRRRSSRGAATSSRGGGRSCRGFGSTRRIDSTPRRERLAGDLSEGARSSSSPLHVRPRLHGGVSGLLGDRRRINGFASTWQPRRRASAVSRAPLAKLTAYKRRMGWTFPWASLSAATATATATATAIATATSTPTSASGSASTTARRDYRITLPARGETQSSDVRHQPEIALPPDGATSSLAMTRNDVATYTRDGRA